MFRKPAARRPRGRILAGATRLAGAHLAPELLADDPILSGIA
jgi:hypothetical protein